MLSLDPTSTVPPYEQLRRQIAGQVAAGELEPGTRLPAVRRLAGDLGVSPGTVARTYRELEQAGVLDTSRRHGTIVSEDPDVGSRPSLTRPGATPVSRAEFVELRASVGWDSPGPAEIEAALALTRAWAVRRTENGELVGMARAVGDGIYLLIVDLVVRPDHQGAGIGRELVETLLAHPGVVNEQHATLLAAPEIAGFCRSLGMDPRPGEPLRL